MKIKSYKMVILPFYYVPHNVLFRHAGDWWKRREGTDQQAERFVETSRVLSSLNNDNFIDPRSLCAMPKSQIEQVIAHAYIVEEFDLSAK
jgi:hypothetical protein